MLIGLPYHLQSFCGRVFPPPKEACPQHGVLNTTLRVVSAQLTTGPLTYEGRTYEGQLLGPTLRVWPGDTLVIRLVNELGVCRLCV